MGFWIAAFALAAAAAMWMARPLAVTRASARPRAAHDEQVFRDQLSEIERDLDRGVLNTAEAEAARIEISRRLLAAAAERAAATDHQPAPRLASYVLALAVVVGAPLMAWGVYGQLGAPGLPDQPLASRHEIRPAQEVAEARTPEAPPMPELAQGETAQLVDRLETQLEGPDADRQGLFLLAQAQGRLGRFRSSWRTYARLIEATDGDAPAAIFASMAEGMILSTSGYISPEAEEALTQALRRDAQNPIARYYMGAAFAQTNRPQSAMETWVGLLEDSPPDAPWIGATRAQMQELAATTGVAIPETVAAATSQMPREVLTMVRGLDERLTEFGGDAEAWAQLVRSYAALGMAPEFEDARSRARAALADDAAELGAFNGAIERAQVAANRAAPPSAGPTATPAPAAGPTREAAAALPGPDAEQVAAAAQLSAEDRQAMIRGMVDGLRERLYEDGGTVDEWARLIRALGVLNEPEAVREAFERGAEANAADASAVSFLRERALVAGASFD